MAVQSSPTTSDIKNLFQVLRLNKNKKITLKPNHSLEFPSQDIDVKQLNEHEMELLINFMGLYGVDYPLPHY